VVADVSRKRGEERRREGSNSKLSLPECLRENYSTSPSYSRRGAEFGLIICSILRLGNGILRPGQSSAKKSVTNNQIYAII
jgi:hypothetical protein